MAFWEKEHHSKVPKSVTVHMLDGRILHGNVFLYENERLLEVMNDKDSPYLAFEDQHGTFMCLNKVHSISSISPFEDLDFMDDPTLE